MIGPGHTAICTDARNVTVRCVSPTCELRAMGKERFREWLGQSAQLADSVQRAAEIRTHSRVRKVIEAAGQNASTVTLRPGDVLFRQGDRSTSFYLVEEGEVQMSLVALADESEETTNALATTEVPVRKYGPGECFGASGLMQGDGFRRNTATALTPVTLRAIPHNHFQVMLKNDSFLKAGLQASHVLHSKRQQYEESDAKVYGKGLAAELYDEEDDEVVQRAMRR